MIVHPAIVHFEIPLPPSVNALYANVPGVGRVKTAKYKAWLLKAKMGLLSDANMWSRAAKRIQTAMLDGYEAIIHVPERMRGDIDGRIKAILDLFVSIGFTPDDKFCRSVTVFRADTQKAGHATVSFGPARAGVRAA